MTCPVRPAWITSVTGQADHAVADDDMAVAIAEGKGLYSTLCGMVIVAAPLVCPPCPPCGECVAALRARATSRTVKQTRGGRQRRGGVLSRWQRWLWPDWRVSGTGSAVSADAARPWWRDRRRTAVALGFWAASS